MVLTRRETAKGLREVRVAEQQVGRSRDGICYSKWLDEKVLQDMFHSQSPSMMWTGEAYRCSRANAMMDHTVKLQRPENRLTAVSNDDDERYLYCLMMTMIFRNFVDRKECPEDSGALERGRKPCLGIEDVLLCCTGDEWDKRCYC